MMSADDEPKKNPATATIGLSTSSSSNNLINEAFNLKPLSNSIGILPPSSSHFKPIQSDGKSKSEPPTASALFADPQSSAFDSAEIHTPIASRPPVLTPPSLNQNLTSTLPPPSSLASVPPPPSSNIAGTSNNSNPYSAKGALNKKVYDTGISVLPVNQSQAFLNPISDPSIPNNGLFIPPAPSPTPSSQTQPPNTVPNVPFPPQPSQPPTTNFAPSQPPTASFVSSLPLQQPSITVPERKTTNSYTAPSNPKKPWGWFSNVVEKVVTTIDPQMKEYIHPANKPIYLVSSMANAKVVHTVREAFCDAGFSKITMNGFDASNNTQFAPQIVGYPCAIQSAKEKLENTINYMQNSECIVVSFQDFIAEITTDNWYELAVVMLKDKASQIELSVFTEAVPVPSQDVAQLQEFTPSDYPLKWSGLSCRLAEKNFNFNQPQTCTYLNYETAETLVSNARLSHALKTIALLYKNKLISMINN